MTLLVAFLEERPLGLAALGAFAVVVGSVLPWISVPQPLIGTTTGNGLQEDGKITILLGLLALGLLIAYARLRQRDLVIAAGIAGLAAAGFAGAYLADLAHNAARVIARLLAGGGPPFDPSQVSAVPARAGAGIYVVFVGAAVMAVGAIALTIRGRGTTEPAVRSSA